MRGAARKPADRAGIRRQVFCLLYPARRACYEDGMMTLRRPFSRISIPAFARGLS
jgi:hypothetical protein